MKKLTKLERKQVYRAIKFFDKDMPYVASLYLDACGLSDRLNIFFGPEPVPPCAHEEVDNMLVVVLCLLTFLELS